MRVINAHHTDGVEMGQVLAQVTPKLAVFSHYNVDPKVALPLVRRHYGGAVEFEEDQMVIDVGEQVSVRRLGASRPAAQR